ncbi:aldolase [Robertmurraya siralis]|uniref:Aldolase n=1 Tax=Robertmurraya siralis TaxID=77777 RepID=A0A919WG77_9BACI|nr:bifunctional 4-hydroxy-2-oxoglutarate aldolase/2-dehydro-3-deoxy-phosphogluconate aldolase [Robertmurraya siralis]PAE20168.1 aldolase [Bacillus sp. 7504-2]GIN61209.1 aldolase [Robertmurraya siralis]
MSVGKGTIIAILRGIEPEDACSIVEVLQKNGITWVEVSLSDETKGLRCIEKIHSKFKNTIQLGAGTVITQKQIDQVLEAGAKYIITPGWERELVRYAKAKNVEIFPGVFTPGEILQAVQDDINVVKLFPANDLGISYIKNLRGPFPNVHIMAVGGVDDKNLKAYYEAGCSSFAIGSDLVPRGATRDNLQQIEEKAQQYTNLIQELGS